MLSKKKTKRYWKDLGVLEEFLYYFIISVIVATIFYLIIGIKVGFGISVFFRSLLISVMFAYTLGIGNQYLAMYFNRKYSWITQTTKRFFIGAMIQVLFSVVASVLIAFVLHAYILSEGEEIIYSARFFWICLLYIFISLTIGLFFTSSNFIYQWKKAVRFQEQLKTETIKAEFEVLKQQTDPHFLYNSLNVLTSLVEENPGKAKEFILKLSKVYRYVLENKSEELITLKQELEFAENYMSLLKTRFGDGLRYSIKVDSQDRYILPTALQILLENTVKHNTASVKAPLEIQIGEQENYLILSNNISERKKMLSGRESFGLENIKKRYKHFTELPVIVQRLNDTFVVKVPILSQMD